MKSGDAIKTVCAAKLSISSTCRTCLNSDADNQLIPIFKNDSLKNNSSIDLLNQLSLLNLKIAKDDGLPYNICVICRDQLITIDLFRKQCTTAQSYLEKHLKLAEITDIVDNSDVDDKKEINIHSENDDFRSECSSKGQDESDFKHSNDESYLCYICGKSFRHERSLNIHLIKHEGARPYACNICDKRFAQKDNLKLHLASHNNVKAYQCEQCGKQFTQQGNLIKHLSLHNAEKMHRCEFCEESFLRIRDLRRHNLTAHGKTDMIIKFERTLPEQDDAIGQGVLNKLRASKKPTDFSYGCNLCNKTFQVPSSLAKHIKVHSEERKFNCTECGYTFKTVGNLKLHINVVHLKRKPYICEICRKSFARVGDRNVHMRTHIDDKPHLCTFCGKSFNLAKVLRAHIRRHTGERPFVCIICNAGFTCHKTLASHTRKQHVKDPQIMNKVDELVQTVLFTSKSSTEVDTT